MNQINMIHACIVRPEGIFHGALGIRDGKIAEIGRNEGELSAAERVWDLSDKMVLPGMIDTHVHIRGGKFSYREDFSSGSKAAAAGGVTCYFEMPICDPPASTAEIFMDREKEIARDSYVDFGLYGGAGADNLDEIEKMSRAGAIGFKTFTMPPVAGREKEFFGLCSEDRSSLIQVMETISQIGGLLEVHSELNEYIVSTTERAIAEGKDGLEAFCEARPEIAEVKAVRRVISGVEETGCHTCIAHVSSAKSAELIQQAKKRGLPVHGEACPQYLFFTAKTAARAGVFARIKPPYRDEKNRKKLLEYYKKSVLETTGSDHAPYTFEEKIKNGQSIWKTFDGLPGIELSLPLLLDLVERKSLTIGSLVANTAENPARIFHLFPHKGRIDLGFDADLVIISKCEGVKRVAWQDLFTKAKKSALLYDNIPLRYQIEKTLVRGEVVYCAGEIVGKPGYGKKVTPIT